MENLTEITANLSKKDHFIQATKRLSQLIQASYADQDDVTKEKYFAACKRTMSLLKSRYSAVGFWKAGRDLFSIALETISATDASLQRERCSALKEWFQSADSEVKAKGGTDDTPTPQPAPTEGTSSASTQQGETPSEPAGRDVESVLQELLLSGMVTLEGGPFGGNSGPPPACRKARFELPVKTVSEADAVCAVCQEELPIKSKAKAMPCDHLFHFDCLMEWLERHNTCPTCRHPLPIEAPTFDLASAAVAARDPTRTTIYS